MNTASEAPVVDAVEADQDNSIVKETTNTEIMDEGVEKPSEAENLHDEKVGDDPTIPDFVPPTETNTDQVIEQEPSLNAEDTVNEESIADASPPPEQPEVKQEEAESSGYFSGWFGSGNEDSEPAIVEDTSSEPTDATLVENPANDAQLNEGAVAEIKNDADGQAVDSQGNAPDLMELNDRIGLSQDEGRVEWFFCSSILYILSLFLCLAAQYSFYNCCPFWTYFIWFKPKVEPVSNQTVVCN